MSTRLRITFRYDIGQRVRWAGRPGKIYRITSQCYETQAVLGPIHRYRLAGEERRPILAYEPDVSALEEDEGEAQATN